MTISACFGRYVPKNHDCNGNKESIDSRERASCASRPKCRAFTNWVRKQSLTIGDFIDSDTDTPYMGANRFEKLVFDIVKRNKARPGTRKKRKGKNGKLTESEKLHITSFKRTLRLLVKHMQAAMPQYSFSDFGKLSCPGQFSILDHSRRLSNRSIDIVQKGGRTADCLVVSLKGYLTRKKPTAILPLSIEELNSCIVHSSREIALLATDISKGNSKKVAVRNINKRRTLLLAEVIAFAYSSGILKAPK